MKVVLIKKLIKRKHNNIAKFILCRDHNGISKGCDKCLMFTVQESLPTGRLPTTKQVLGYLFYITINNYCGQQQKNIPLVASDVILHWIACNVYTGTHRSVQNKLTKLLDNYTYLKKQPKIKRGEIYCNNLNLFKRECDALCGIKCLDPLRLKDQPKRWNVKQTEEDFDISLLDTTVKFPIYNYFNFNF